MPHSPITIDSRFNGPPNSGQVGYVCGCVAHQMDGPAEITLRKPIPLGVALDPNPADESGLVLVDGDTVIVEARSNAMPEIEIPPAPGLTAAEEATRQFISSPDHPYPMCFVCGNQRPDGMKIFAGRADSKPYRASIWTPSREYGNENNLVREEFSWAALDCPAGFAIMDDGRAMLGRMTALIEGTIAVDETHIVIGWKIFEDGRKRFAGSAIFSAAGDRKAWSYQTWIVLKG